MHSPVQCGIAVLSLLGLSCGKVDGADAPTTPDTGGSSATSGGASGSSGASGKHSGGTASGGAAGEAQGATGGDGKAGSSGATGDLKPSSVSVNGAPIYTRVQRLTNAQWEHAVTDILRLPRSANLAQVLPAALAGTTDFTNNERVLNVDARWVTEVELATESAAALATASADALAGFYPGTDRDGFVRTLGRRAFRRPLTPEEELKYQDAFALGEKLYGDGFAHGASFVIRAMLESPRFLYRSELGPAGEPLDGYEVASKLSFLLLGTTPSDALLDAAAAGALDDVEELERTARQMLEQPAALSVMRDFHGQLYHLDRYANVSKVGVPEYSAALNPELAEVSYRFFDDVFAHGQGVRDIFTSTSGFVGPGLASLYAIEPAPSALERRELGPSRLGYFMQVPFLLLNGMNREPDSIQRGVNLQLDALCMNLSPPASLPPPVPPTKSGQTNRERVSALTAGCGLDCHRYLEPLGFAFENFDGMGQYRELDNGRAVDSSGSYPFADGTREFADARELMQILAGTVQTHTCYAKKLSSYALQRDIVEDDRPLLDSLAAVSRGQSIKELIVSLVKDPAFRFRQAGTP